jgi:hypothetical protein
MANNVKCPVCKEEFGFFTWRHTCFVCGKDFCSKHFVEFDVAEAKRRFGAAAKKTGGEGACSGCDPKRISPYKDGWRDALSVQDKIYLPPHAGCGTLLAERRFRMAQGFTDGKANWVVLAPESCWDYQLGVFRLSADSDRQLLTGEELLAGWQALLPVLLGDSDPTAKTKDVKVDQAFQPRHLQRIRELWTKEERDRRLQWILGFAPDKDLLGLSARERAQVCSELVLGLVLPVQTENTALIAGAGGAAVAAGLARTAIKGASRVAPIVGGVAIGVGIAVLAYAWANSDKAALTQYLERVQTAAKADDDKDGLRKLREAGSLLLGELEGEGAEASSSQREREIGLARFLLWIAEPRPTLLADAAACAGAHPLAVALHAAQTGDAEGTSRWLAAHDQHSGQFPWKHLLKQVRACREDPHHWSKRQLDCRPQGRLATGNFKEVWLLDRGHTVLAMSKPGCADSVRREVDLLLKLGQDVSRAASHMGVLTIQQAGSLTWDGAERVGYVTERLFEDRPAGPMDAAVAVSSANLVGQTLALLHGLGYVHGDIKPDNILWSTSDRPTLVDFGGAVRLDSGGSATMQVLSDAYAAPEQRQLGQISPASDVYALARTLQAWWSRAPDAPTAHDLAKHHRQILESMDAATSDDPAKRPTLSEFLAVLQRWHVLSSQPKSRLSTAEERADMSIAQWRLRWINEPTADTLQALQNAVRGQLLLSDTASAMDIRQASRVWLDFARLALEHQLWLPLAAYLRNTEPAFQAIAGCLQAVDAAMVDPKVSRTSVSPARLLRFLQTGDGAPDLLLSQSEQYLARKEYKPLQGAVVVLWHGQGIGTQLAELTATLRWLGALRNASEHGSPGLPPRPEGRPAYGTLMDNKLQLTRPEIALLQQDCVRLLTLLLGSRSVRTHPASG